MYNNLTFKVFGILIMLLNGIILSAEKNTDNKLITVTGEAAVYVVPDEVVIYLSIATINKDINAANLKNEDIVRKVLETAKDYKIPDKDINADYLKIFPKYDYNYNKSDEFIGYEVKKSISIKLKDIAKYESLIRKLLSNGVNYIHDIEFRTVELRKYRDQARLLAINAAVEKANLIAGGLKVKVGKPHSVTEEPAGWSYFNNLSQNVIQEQNSLRDDSSGSDDNSQVIGQIKIKAKITVSFGIE